MAHREQARGKPESQHCSGRLVLKAVTDGMSPISSQPQSPAGQQHCPQKGKEVRHCETIPYGHLMWRRGARIPAQPGAECAPEVNPSITSFEGNKGRG